MRLKPTQTQARIAVASSFIFIVGLIALLIVRWPTIPFISGNQGQVKVKGLGYSLITDAPSLESDYQLHEAFLSDMSFATEDLLQLWLANQDESFAPKTTSLWLLYPASSQSQTNRESELSNLKAWQVQDGRLVRLSPKRVNASVSTTQALNLLAIEETEDRVWVHYQAEEGLADATRLAQLQQAYEQLREEETRRKVKPFYFLDEAGLASYDSRFPRTLWVQVP